MTDEKNKDKTWRDFFSNMPCADMMAKMMGGSKSGPESNCSEMLKGMQSGKNKMRFGDCLKMMRNMCCNTSSDSERADQT